MTAPNRRNDNRLSALLRAADRARAAHDREARRRAEDALEVLERRDLHDAVVLAEAELLRIATSQTTARTIRCGAPR